MPATPSTWHVERSTDRHEERKRVAWPLFCFVCASRDCTSGPNMSRPTTGLNTASNRQPTGSRFHTKTSITFPLFFWIVPDIPLHVCTNIRADMKISGLRMFNINKKTSLKIDNIYIRTLSNYEATPIFAICSYKSPNVHAVSQRKTLKFAHMLFYVLPERTDRRGLFYYLFCAEKVLSRRLSIFAKNENKKNIDRKSQTICSGELFVSTHTRGRVVQNMTVSLEKTVLTLAGEYFSVVSLESPRTRFRLPMWCVLTAYRLRSTTRNIEY